MKLFSLIFLFNYTAKILASDAFYVIYEHKKNLYDFETYGSKMKIFA